MLLQIEILVVEVNDGIGYNSKKIPAKNVSAHTAATEQMPQNSNKQNLTYLTHNNNHHFTAITQANLL